MAARAISSSWAEEAPDTPIAPMIRPSTTMGTPPATGTMPSSASSAIRPPVSRSSDTVVAVEEHHAISVTVTTTAVAAKGTHGKWRV